MKYTRFSIFLQRKTKHFFSLFEISIICRSRQIEREEKLLQNFLARTESLINEAYEAEGPYFMTTLSLIMMKPTDWEKNRLTFLQKLLLTAHIRSANTPNDRSKVASKAMKTFATYKTTLVFFGLINAFFIHMLKPVRSLKYIFQLFLSFSVAFGFNRPNTLQSTISSISSW